MDERRMIRAERKRKGKGNERNKEIFEEMKGM